MSFLRKSVNLRFEINLKKQYSFLLGSWNSLPQTSFPEVKEDFIEIINTLAVQDVYRGHPLVQVMPP